MHVSAVLVIFLAVLAARADLTAWKTTPTPLPQGARFNRLTVSARGGSRIAGPDLAAPAGILRTTLSERKTPTPTIAAFATQPTDTPSTGGPSPAQSSEVVTRTKVITYVVQPGDVVGDIGQKFNVSADTVCWANGKLEDNPDFLQVGQVLIIPPVTGVLHTVQRGDTLEGIAKIYKAKVGDIVAFPGNGLGGSRVLVEGQQLMVPNGQKPYVPRMVVAWRGPIPQGAKKGSGFFVWPTTGVITQKYWERHKAIDIAWVDGTTIHAADSGYVVQVGHIPEGYGRFVLIDHGNGFQSLYSHFSVYYVAEGQSVAKGEKIGLMGSTGRSTGPHLHFEIRKYGECVNPLIYLP